MSQSLVRVALPVPFEEAFDYLVPATLAVPTAGSRVRVPFGRTERVGIVVEHPATSSLPRAKLKPIGAVLDPVPAIGAELLQTLRFAADYYHHALGAVLSHALPTLLRTPRALDDPPEPHWRSTALGRSQPQESLASRAPRQAAALAVFSDAALSATELAERGVARTTLEQLAKKGWVERAPPEAPTVPNAVEPIRAAMPELSADQQTALRAIAATQSPKCFKTYLLHGVTGSGKTEVYLRLIAAELAASRQTLMLVPEIGLTPQLVSRLRERFGEELAVLHSAATERERLLAWRRAYRCEARLVVGTRSAVFAPLPRCGLIVVDEEHDASYKQQTGFRYSARDLAIVRAQRLKVPVILGSATPSLETFHNALSKRYVKLDLPRRVGSAGTPRLRVIDLNLHASRQGLSTPLVAAITEHLNAGNQVLLFLNRRGFAPALFCVACKRIEQCERCDAHMIVHARAGAIRCHHCGRERPLQWTCRGCGAERVAVGAGTERVEDELAALFPAARIARLDRDSTSRKHALPQLLAEVEAGRTQILVGTQMLTKGHDFPRVTLVGVLNADQGLFGSDPRSHERLAQTILQVAGRAGRAALPGEVMVQTHYPEHPLLHTLLTQGYEAFASLALAERRTAAWPPFAHLVVWRAEATHREAAMQFLEEVRRAATTTSSPVTILGPAPLAMERKEGRYRAQLLFRSAQRSALHRLVTDTLASTRRTVAARKVRFSVDVDPLEV